MINELSLLKSKPKKVYLTMTSKLGGAYLKVSPFQKKLIFKNSYKIFSNNIKKN